MHNYEFQNYTGLGIKKFYIFYIIIFIDIVVYFLYIVVCIFDLLYIYFMFNMISVSWNTFFCFMQTFFARDRFTDVYYFIKFIS